MKSIDEITQALGQPAGTWEGVSECLETIKQNPLAYKAHLATPATLLQLFDAETLRQHQIYVLTPSDHLRIESPGKYIFIGGEVIQNHYDAESWLFGDAVVEVIQGKAHGYDHTKMQLFTHTEGDAHDHCKAISVGQYVRLTAYDDTNVDFYRSGVLELFGNARAHVSGWNTTVVAHDQTRLIAEDVFRITAKDQSFIEAHNDCRLALEDQAACVAYGNCKIEARGQNRVWMLDDNCRPLIAYAETIFCKAYEDPSFRRAIHDAVQSDRSVPELMSRLSDLTVAYGPTIRENWDYGEEAIWLVKARLNEEGKFVNVPEKLSSYPDIYPTKDDYDNLEIRVYVTDAYSESSAMLNQLLEKRGYYTYSDPHYDPYATFGHWGNAQMFLETVRYEEAVLHKLRPAVQLQEEPHANRAQKNAGHRGV